MLPSASRSLTASPSVEIIVVPTSYSVRTRVVLRLEGSQWAEVLARNQTQLVRLFYQMIASAFGLQPNNVNGLRMTIGSIVFDFILVRPPSQPLSDTAIEARFGTNDTVAELLDLYHGVTGMTSAGIVGLSVAPSYFDERCGNNCLAGIGLGASVGFLAVVAVTLVLLARCRRRRICWWGHGPCAYWWRSGSRPAAEPRRSDWYIISSERYTSSEAFSVEAASEGPALRKYPQQRPQVPKRFRRPEARAVPPTSHQPTATSSIIDPLVSDEEEFNHVPFGQATEAPNLDTSPRVSPVFCSTSKAPFHQSDLGLYDDDRGDVQSASADDEHGGMHRHRMGVCEVDERFLLEMQHAMSEHFDSSQGSDDANHHIIDSNGFQSEVACSDVRTTRSILNSAFGSDEHLAAATSRHQHAPSPAPDKHHQTTMGDAETPTPAVGRSISGRSHLQDSSPTFSMRRALYSSWKSVPLTPCFDIDDTVGAPPPDMQPPPVAPRAAFRLPPPTAAVSANRTLLFDIARDVSYEGVFCEEPSENQVAAQQRLDQSTIVMPPSTTTGTRDLTERPRSASTVDLPAHNWI
jgi:hypothetical protein